MQNKWIRCLLVWAMAMVYTPFVQADIAYLQHVQGYWQVWLLDENSKSTRQITTSRYDKSRLSWFPDGRSLLVNGNQGQIAQVDIASGEETRVDVQLPGSLKGIFDAVVSPDGQLVAFSLSTSDSVDDNNIWVMQTNGENPRRLTNMQALQHNPAWHPDGQWIYFLSGDGKQDHNIWRCSVDGQRKEQITVGNRYHFDVAIAQNGTLAYSNNQNGNYDIWLQDKGESKAIVRSPAFDGHPSWSPDASVLAFESTRDGKPNIWTYSLKARTSLPLTQADVGARMPVWGPVHEPAQRDGEASDD